MLLSGDTLYVSAGAEDSRGVAPQWSTGESKGKRFAPGRGFPFANWVLPNRFDPANVAASPRFGVCERSPMSSSATGNTSAPTPGGAGYKVLGLDDTLYGPVEIPQLVEWARDERIQPDSWLFCVSSRRWVTAADLPELCSQFPSLSTAAVIAPELQPDQLRKVKVFAELTLDQLRRVAGYADVQHFPVGTVIIRAGGIGDSVFFVLNGSVRLKILVRGKELPISQVASGGVFGQISLFDSGPRVTDALAESDITCARITVFNFRRLFRAAPDLAVPIILGLGRTLASRIRTDDKHLCELAARQEAMG